MAMWWAARTGCGSCGRWSGNGGAGGCGRQNADSARPDVHEVGGARRARLRTAGRTAWEKSLGERGPGGMKEVLGAGSIFGRAGAVSTSL